MRASQELQQSNELNIYPNKSEHVFKVPSNGTGICEGRRIGLFLSQQELDAFHEGVDPNEIAMSRVVPGEIEGFRIPRNARLDINGRGHWLSITQNLIIIEGIAEAKLAEMPSYQEEPVTT